MDRHIITPQEIEALRQQAQKTEEVPSDVALMTQEEFCASTLYPQEVGNPVGVNVNEHVKIMKFFSFNIIDGCDLHMWHVDLPSGWKKVPAKDEGWCYVLDEKGRRRAAIFMKKSTTILPTAHINYVPRYRPLVSHTALPRVSKSYRNTPLIGQVTDGSLKVLYKTKIRAMHYQYGSPKYGVEEKKIRIAIFKECERWLETRFPDWENIMAYWDAD
jgi:hypothetical protein